MSKLIVYVGPTLSTQTITENFHNVVVNPPLQRDQLKTQYLNSQIQTNDSVLVIDGQFSGIESPPVSDFRWLATKGVNLIGASSLGAVRAMECSPIGMKGIGWVYRQFREGRFTSDADVAVRMDPETAYKQLTVPICDIVYYCDSLYEKGILSDASRRDIISSARNIYYLDRTQETFNQLLRTAGINTRTKPDKYPFLSVKKLDALDALTYCTSMLDRKKPLTAPAEIAIAKQTVRLSRSGLASELKFHEIKHFIEWELATGRYARSVRTQSFLTSDSLECSVAQIAQVYGALLTATEEINSLPQHSLQNILHDLSQRGVLEAEIIAWRAFLSLRSRFTSVDHHLRTCNYIDIKRQVVAYNWGFMSYSDFTEKMNTLYNVNVLKLHKTTDRNVLE